MIIYHLDSKMTMHATTISAPDVQSTDPRLLLQAAARTLSARPGVYIMKDRNGSVIYVGKAVNLRRRVSGYATISGQKDSKVRKLVAEFASLSCIETPSEIQALLVESRLIKEKIPAFNRRLIEPESCRYLRVDLREDLPQIEVVRSRNGDGATYLGPFWSSAFVEEATLAVTNVFKLRRCTRETLPGSKEWACIYHDLQKCSGPCSGKVSREEYRKAVHDAWRSLGGKSDLALAALLSRRDRLSDELRFEDAFQVHRQVRALELVAALNPEAVTPTGTFGLIAPSYMRGRPVALVFSNNRLIAQFTCGPRTHPNQSVIENALEQSAASKRDLLPGRPTIDDMLIVSSYVRHHDLDRFIIPMPDGASSARSAESLSDAIRDFRKRSGGVVE
jgi:predicted GIY-YIG superfamily endonuclease